ncbi:MAG TPA: amidohydrolase family protein [Acidimicrobiales bacterium]
MDRVLMVSSDSHAGMPREQWPEYLPQKFHELIPALHEDNDEIYPRAIALLTAKADISSFPEHEEAHRDGWHGLHDPQLRMAEMDREGIAAELIYLGDSRLGDMFCNVTQRDYGLEPWEAGAQGWNRWAADTFGFAKERLLVTGAIGPCVDMATTVAELEWIADHGFVGTYGPGYMSHPGMPPLFDAYWEPFWATCEALGLAVVVHAGYGTMQGQVFPEVQRMYDAAADAAGTTDPDALMAHADAVSMDSMIFFDNWVNHNVASRRPMWQLMLGGVFDRHPDLKVILTEIRVDWIPATLDHLDKVFAENGADRVAERAPSDYWRSNFLAGASFIHKVEAEMCQEIGVEQILFGRDYPHLEGTWPHTADWLRIAFNGVSEHDARLMLGENAVRFLNLDRARLTEVAQRIGPSIDQIIDGGTEIRPELLQNFANRGGFLKPAEGADRLPLVDTLVREDLANATAIA